MAEGREIFLLDQMANAEERVLDQATARAAVELSLARLLVTVDSLQYELSTLRAATQYGSVESDVVCNALGMATANENTTSSQRGCV